MQARDSWEIPITQEMKEQAKGFLVHKSLLARALYEGKTNEELEEIVCYQIWLHYYGCVDSRDDVELCVCKGILVEDRGYSWDIIDLLWYGVVMEHRRNGMEYQVSYSAEHGDGPIDYTKPTILIKTIRTYIKLSGDELAECYL